MDDRHVIYNTTVIGLVFLVVCWVTIYLWRSPLAIDILKWMNLEVVSHRQGASEALARWIAVGVSVNFIGMVIQVISIILFQDEHATDPAREEFAAFIRDKSTGCSTGIQAQIRNGTDDSLFAFFHYKYSPKELIEWGRTRKRYVYVGENWSAAIILGIVIGTSVIGAMKYAEIFPEHPENKDLLVIIAIILAVSSVIGLINLKTLNKKAVGAMDGAVMATLLKKFSDGNMSINWPDTLDSREAVRKN